MQLTWRYLRLALILILTGAWVAGTAWSVTRATDYSWALWLEHWTGDIRTALFSHRPKRMHSQIALVTINDETMQPYAYRSPIDRRLLAKLITNLDRAGVRAIGLDFLFLKHTEVDKDAELIAAIKNARSRIVVAAGDRRIGLTSDQSKYQAAFLKKSGAVGGYANLLTGGDRIVRYVAKPDDPAFTKSFAVALAKPSAEPLTNGPRRIAWLLTPYDDKPRFFSMAAHLLVTPSGKPTSAAPILLKTYFKDKIVIIGGDFPDLDRHQIPMLNWRGEDDEIAGMLIQAQIAAQLLDGRSIEHVHRNILTGIFAFLALLGLWFGLRHGIVAISLYATTASILVVAADMTLFHFFDRIIPFGACLMALLLGVAGGVLLRFLHIANIRTN